MCADLCERHFQASAMARSRCGPLARRNSRMLALIWLGMARSFMVFPERQNPDRGPVVSGVNQGSTVQLVQAACVHISFRVAALAAATLASIVAWPASPDGSSSRKRNRLGQCRLDGCDDGFRTGRGALQRLLDSVREGLL